MGQKHRSFELDDITMGIPGSLDSLADPMTYGAMPPSLQPDAASEIEHFESARTFGNPFGTSADIQMNTASAMIYFSEIDGSGSSHNITGAKIA